LTALGAEVVAFDPEAIATTRAALGEGEMGDGRLDFAAGAYEAAEGADALIIATEWPEFRRPDLARVRRSMRRPLVFDGRNVFEPSEMAAAGFTYHAVGRPFVEAAEVEERVG
jgi:UDPglucose 6-dehydrogenase